MLPCSEPGVPAAVVIRPEMAMSAPPSESLISLVTNPVRDPGSICATSGDGACDVGDDPCVELTHPATIAAHPSRAARRTSGKVEVRDSRRCGVTVILDVECGNAILIE